MDINLETQFGAWTSPASPVSVSYSLAVLAEIREAVAEGVRQLTRGLEVGGVLYGDINADGAGHSVRVLAMRPIDCEHAYGPSFQLSEKDMTGLIAQLRDYGEDAALTGCQPVGWFVSHPRRDIAMQPSDVEIFEAFFPGPAQVTLVIRPGRGGSMRGGFFVRETDGKLKTDRSYLDFSLPGQPNAAGNPTGNPTATRPADLPAPMEAADRLGAGAVYGQPYGQPSGQTYGQPQSGRPAAGPVAVAAATELRSFGEPPVQQNARAARASGLWMWLVAAALTGALAAVAGINILKTKTLAEPLALAVLDHNGQLQIQWNHASQTVLGAARGVIEIVDGQDHRTLPITAQELAQGTYTYSRKSGDVQVRMAVTDSSGNQTQEASRFLGSPPSAQLPSPGNGDGASEKDLAAPVQEAAATDSSTDDQALRAENARQKARIQQLERIVVILQNRLSVADPGTDPVTAPH